MISACESDEFMPYGREFSSIHPGRSPLQIQGTPIADHGLPIVNTLRDISISQSSKKDFWMVRRSNECDGCDEELYIKDQLVVWSRGTLDGAGQVIKSFTLDSPVEDALWCTFLLPEDKPLGDYNQNDALMSDDIGVKEHEAICVIEANRVSIFSTNGKDYVTGLPFPVFKTWSVKNGLLFERANKKVKKDQEKTPARGMGSSPSLPVMFSMLHPLDEVAPVICRTGGICNPKISFVTETSQHIVFCSEDPSLVVTYDTLLSRHAVWNLRRAKPGEGFMMPTPAATPSQSQSASSFSRLTISSQSPSISPFMSYGSHINSPSASYSRLNSPSFSKAAMLSRSQSPSTSFMRLLTQTPSPSRSPAACPRSPLSMSASAAETTFSEPLHPEICLEHLWTENVSQSRDEALGQASKVFLNTDLCGQKFLCYLISYRNQLRCVKFEESNDNMLIFGSVSVVPARDAAPLTTLHMNLILDMNYNLILYSGATKMNQVHVAGLPAPLNISCSMVGPPPLLKCLSQPQPSTPFGSPVHLNNGPFTSSRPPSALDGRFDDEVRLLSPVPTELDSSEFLEGSMAEDVSFQASITTGPIASLRDAVDNRITLELMDGQLYRTSLPKLASSPLVSRCLEAIKQMLPRDVAMSVLVRWYCTRNAPGSINGQSEWLQFSCCLLGLVGYDTNNLPILNQQGVDKSLSPVVMPKKAKPSDQGSEEDWSYMLMSDHHQLVTVTYGPSLGLYAAPTPPSPTSTSPTGASIDIAAPLFSHLPALTFALHMVYEDTKLETLYTHTLPQLASLLMLLTSDMRCDLYADHYCRDFPHLFNSVDVKNTRIPQEAADQLNLPNYMTQEPPSICHWLLKLLQGQQSAPYPYLKGISLTTAKIIGMYLALLTGEDLTDDATWTRRLRSVPLAGYRPMHGMTPCLPKDSWMTADDSDPYERAVIAMVNLGATIKEGMMFGITLPLKEAVYHCRHNPPANWPPHAYNHIGREDLAQQKQEDVSGMTHTPSRDMGLQCKVNREEDDGMEFLDKELLKLRFSDDLRIQEVRRLLQSSRPVRIVLMQKPEVSDHEFIEEQERHLFSICIRTMSLALGRGMLTLSTYRPVPTETLPIPKLCLTGRSPPRNTTVDLVHIDTPPNMSAWPQFHNGVAAGLRIANSQLDSTWITYNRPKNNELTNEHAGFLMGLGLNGHLSGVSTLNVHDYLLKSHDMTSIGMLLGVAAGKRGTMDVATTRMLSIHVTALLPPTSTELDLGHGVQVAAILGVGLVYQATTHRRMAEVLLAEIGRPPGPEMENCADRESYSLAAGLALGNVMLGKGSEAKGLSDLNMADQLYHYMVGAHKRPLTGANKERYKSPSYQIKEGDYVNVDVTSPGATLALGLMFFKTKNSAVAEWLTAPDTQFLLEFVRPDFLMLRIMARGLVMWDDIQPNNDWINSNIPPIVLKYAFRKSQFKDDPTCASIDFETMSQAYCNILAGCCLAMALRFASSANQPAFHCLKDRVHKAVQFMGKAYIVEQAGRSTVENCLIITVLSLAIVMAGTGNLEVLRICRHLRSRVGPSSSHVLYGSHMAISMSIGLLFMGGGQFCLSTSPPAVAAMVMAFFPKFPIHSNDNRYHLQAFRHLYVLASEPRVIIPRDVDTGRTCYVPLHVTFKDNDAYQNQSYKTMAPCVLPELNLLKQVTVLGPRYWPIDFQEANWSCLRNILRGTGYMYVKQRAGHLSYQEDPKGYHSVLSQSITKDQSIGNRLQSADIKSLSSDPLILAFAEYLCYSHHPQEYESELVLSRVLFECVSQEKPEMLASHIALEQLADTLPTTGAPLALWQLKVMAAFYDWLEQQGSMVGIKGRDEELLKRRLVSCELLTAISSRIHDHLETTPGVRQLLVDYLRGELQQCTEVQALGCLLTWHDLPHPYHLANINYSGVPCFAELYELLRPFNLTTSGVMSVLSALQTHKRQHDVMAT